jgi:hypothetical protein
MASSASRSSELAVVAHRKRVAAAAIAFACAEFLEAPPIFLLCVAAVVGFDP